MEVYTVCVCVSGCMFYPPHQKKKKQHKSLLKFEPPFYVLKSYFSTFINVAKY